MEMPSEGAVALGLLVAQSPLVAWAIWSIRQLAKEQAQLAEKGAIDMLKTHNSDPQAHPTHHVAVEFHEMQIRMVHALAELMPVSKTLPEIQKELHAVSTKITTFEATVASMKETHDKVLEQCIQMRLYDRS